MPFAQALGQAGEDFLFTVVSASPNDYRRPLGHSQLAQHSLNIGTVFANDFRSVKLATAEDVDSLFPAAEFQQPLGVSFALRPDPREAGKQTAEHEPKSPVALE